jgi:8-amino-7-oxononanoate synthase
MLLHSGASTLDKLMEALDEELHALRNQDLFRTLSTIEERRGCTARIDGKWLVLWCTNDYLGLSMHPRVVGAACEAARCWGVGARASRLLAGSTQLHEHLEQQLAEFFHTEAALVYPSGYQANLGTLSALLSRQDLVLVDRFAHASLIDACRASHATLRVFRHNDAGHVANLLGRYAAARRRLVVTEGVFSMDGDHAPLGELVDVVQRAGAVLYLDDAHGAFATGASGRGSPEVAGIPHDTMLYMGTLGKALGCQGGFVVGPRALVEFLRNRARTFIYSTALAVPVVAAAREALRLVHEDPTPRLRLAQHVEQFHARLSSLQPLRPTLSRKGRVHPSIPSHIVPIVVGSARQACELTSQLLSRGMFAPAIRPPTVPQGTARLRISLTALHTAEQLEQLAAALCELVNDSSSFH